MADAVLARLMRALDLVAIERQPDGTFYAMTPGPSWFTRAFGEAEAGARHTLAGAFPFLDDFVPQATGAWAAGREASIVSGPFSVDVAGEAVLLRATALTVDGRALLVLERLTGAADVRPMLQRARERMLESETQSRHASALHAPAAAMASAIDQLERSALDADQRAVVERLREAHARVADVLAHLPAPPAKTRKL